MLAIWQSLFASRILGRYKRRGPYEFSSSFESLLRQEWALLSPWTSGWESWLSTECCPCWWHSRKFLPSTAFSSPCLHQQVLQSCVLQGMPCQLRPRSNSWQCGVKRTIWSPTDSNASSWTKWTRVWYPKVTPCERSTNATSRRPWARYSREWAAHLLLECPLRSLEQVRLSKCQLTVTLLPNLATNRQPPPQFSFRRKEEGLATFWIFLRFPLEWAPKLAFESVTDRI